MSRRKDAKALARWDNEARQWATATGRDLALDLYYNRETAARPYGVGVVLGLGREGVGRGAGQVQPRLASTDQARRARAAVGPDVAGDLCSGRRAPGR